MATQKRYLFRYLLISLIFCIVCIIYLGRLFYVQLAGRGDQYDTGTTVQTVKVQAVRGEILDRNGVPLVSNRYYYDLKLSHSAISTIGPARANEVYLRLLGALDACGARDTHTEKYFPFLGTYPDYALSPDAQDTNTPIGYRFARVLKERNIKADATVQEILTEYTDRFQLLKTDEAGTRLYSDYEVDRLLRLLYDMDAMQFSAANDYLFAARADISLMTYVQEMSLDGVQFTVSAERVYNYPGYASHILGSVGPIYAEEWDYYNEQGYQMNAVVGKSGCEAAFESYLHGTDGEWRVTLDAAGNILQTEVITQPISGKDVYLTIDINLQIAAEDGLAENVQYIAENDSGAVAGFPCDAGAAVAMDPKTFDILAIASYPTFDLSTYNRDYNTLLANEARPLVNRALRETYAPGSTVKPGVALAGLNEGKITAYSTISCTGKYTRFDDYQPACSTYPHSGTNISVAEAIGVSCNSFFYELGYQLGIRTMDDYLSAMGFGQNTGIELGEAIGVLAGSPGSYAGLWRPGDTIAAAIGQSDTRATPLQICAYTATLANGGTRYATHLLDRVCEFGSDTPIYTDEALLAAPLSQLTLSESSLNATMNGMERVTATGTVRRFLNQCGVSSTVSGKTGTAQVEKYLTDGATGEVTKHMITNALFVATATRPGEVSPGIAISVVIEKASAGTLTSLTAARIISAWEKSN